MRIVHVCRVGWPSIGGMESMVTGLARALVGRGHDVRVVTLDTGPYGEALPVGTFGGVAYERLPRLGPRRYPFASGLVDRVRGADLVHAHGLDGLTDTLVLGRRAHGVPVGVSTHGGYFHTDRNGWVKEAWRRTGTAVVLRAADAVWFTSEADRRRLGVPGEVVPNGVDVERFARIVRRPEPGRWLVPGRVDVHKGLDDLIDALAALRSIDERPFHVDVAGPASDPALLRGLVERAAAKGLADRITFLGGVGVSALDQHYARAEMCLFPSRYEGFGIALVEAMAAGVPVVARRIEAFEALVRDGVDGWLVDWSAPDDVARRLVALRDVDAAPIAAAAKESAAAYGWDERVVAWESAYSRIVRP